MNESIGNFVILFVFFLSGYFISSIIEKRNSRNLIRTLKETNEKLSKTQMAFGMTMPIEVHQGKAFCIHCAHKIDLEKSLQFNHNRDCIWLLSVLAIGDYEGE